MNRLTAGIISLLLALAVAGCFGANTVDPPKYPMGVRSDPYVATEANDGKPNCRPEPLAGVYHPQRLEIKEPCKTVSGTVASVKKESDGDYHINVKLDDQYADMINDKNKTAEHGSLVVEIIPLDEQNIPKPKKGERIDVTGAYVLDKKHGWIEIHPAWIVNGKGNAQYDKKMADKFANQVNNDD